MVHIVSEGVYFWDIRNITQVEVHSKDEYREVMKKKTNTGMKKTNDGLRRSKSTRWKYNGSSSKGSVGETSDDGNNDKVELLEKGFEDGLKEKEFDVQSFDRKYFRTELGLIPHEKIETYQHRIHPFDEKHMNDFLVEYRRMGNDV